MLLAQLVLGHTEFFLLPVGVLLVALQVLIGVGQDPLGLLVEPEHLLGVFVLDLALLLLEFLLDLVGVLVLGLHLCLLFLELLLELFQDLCPFVLLLHLLVGQL